MLKIILPVLSLLIGLTLHTNKAFAESFTSETVCAENQPYVCASIKSEQILNSVDEGVFVVSFKTPKDSPVENLAVDLFMDMGNGHGHGSAPVEVQQLQPANQFQVQNAWFIMQGPWLVRLNFVFNQKNYQINIPIQIQE